LSLRLAGLGGLIALLWNPVSTMLSPGGSPTVLLDASLSMKAAGGRWTEGVDSALKAAGAGSREPGAGVVWRFGVEVEAFDTVAPRDGASRLGPALRAAAAREGPIVIVTDGDVDDVATVPSDLLTQARVIALPRAAVQGTDYGIERVEAQGRYTPSDTVVVEVTVARGSREQGAGSRMVVLRQGARELARVPLRFGEGAGATRVRLSAPGSRLPAGFSVLEVALRGPADLEPRNDARKLVVEVSRAPSIVIVAAPADWEARFLSRALTDVVRAPLRTYMETEPGRWRDASTLRVATRNEVASAVRSADLVIARGEPARYSTLIDGATRRWLWPTASPVGAAVIAGDWYVGSPPASPLAAALAGVIWDSVPPAQALVPIPPTVPTTAWIGLSARLARRSAERPLVLGYDSAGTRTVWYAGDGLWRWSFRGGAPAESYRALVAATTDWLLERRSSRAAVAVTPVAAAVTNGLPVEWRWTGAAEARPVPLELSGSSGTRRDTLRFDASGRAALRLPVGEYRWRVAGSREPGAEGQGVVVVEDYSPEWTQRPATLNPQPGLGGARRIERALRERWWLFLLVIGLFAMEWAWRRRIGLP
jgi:hypothetical protein